MYDLNAWGIGGYVLMLCFLPGSTHSLDQVLLGDGLPASEVSCCDFGINFDARVRGNEVL